MTKIADDSTSIAARLKEIQEEKLQAIMGVPLEDPKPVEAPKDIDWTAVDSVYGMYGNPNAVTVAAMKELDEPKDLARVFMFGNTIYWTSGGKTHSFPATGAHVRYRTEQEIADWRKDYGL